MRLILTFLLALFCLNAHAANLNEAQKIFDFANSLQAKGEYYRAITEYQRLESYYPNSEFLPQANLAIVESYLKGGKLEPGLAQAKKVVEKYPQHEVAHQALWHVSNALFEIHRHNEAKAYLEYLLHHYPHNPNYHEAKAMLSAIYLILNERDKALELDSQMNLNINQIEIPQKNIRTAGVLSTILPGAGQFYAERYVDGTVAFFLNVAFIGATVSAADSDNIPLAVIMGFFGIGWYGGNIYNAMNSAQKFNEKTLRKASRDYYQEKRSPSLQLNFQF